MKKERENKKKIWAMGNRCSDIGKWGRQEGREETNMMLQGNARATAAQIRSKRMSPKTKIQPPGWAWLQ